MTADQTRGWLLERAEAIVQQAIADGVDPGAVDRCLRAGWPPGVPVPADFLPVGAGGVEGMAFVVFDEDGASAGGLVLRVPGEYPDSFESVDLEGIAGPGRADVVNAFLHRTRPPLWHQHADHRQ